MAMLGKRLLQCVQKSFRVPSASVTLRGLATYSGQFSWRNQGVTTRIVNQEGPTCQIHAVLAAMELNYQVHQRFGVNARITSNVQPRKILLKADELKTAGKAWGVKKNEEETGKEITRFRQSYQVAQHALKYGVPLDGPDMKGMRCYMPSVWILKRRHNFTADDLVGAIKKQPVVISLWAKFTEAEIEGEYHFFKLDGEKPDTGHAVVAIGCIYKDDDLYIQIHNSWGDSWGNRGYGYVQFSSCVKTYKLLIPIMTRRHHYPIAAGTDPDAFRILRSN